MVAEAGHAANRMYLAQDGSLHLNGAKVWDASEVDVTASQGTSGTIATLTSTTAIEQLVRLSPQPTDTYSATMTIDVTYTYHVVAGLFATSATVAYTPSAAGTAGDVVIIRTASGAGGTVTATFAATFHSSGTQATTTGTFSTIMFVSDGTRWLEVSRTTALA